MNWNLIYTIIAVLVCIGIFMYSQWLWALHLARRHRIYPEKGKATLYDVRRLIILGEKELAVMVYCEIFGVHRKEARAAVEQLEKSIQERDLEKE